MLFRPVKKHQCRAAFTLMEMLIVVAIIVALAGISIFALVPMYEGAKKDTARTKAYAIEQACTIYYTKHDSFPTDVEQLTKKDDRGGPYLKREGVRDPWGNVYKIRPSTKGNEGSVEIYTQAPDGKEIGNWKSETGE